MPWICLRSKDTYLALIKERLVVPQKIAKLGRLFNNLQLIHSFSNCIERNVNTQ